MKNENTQEAPPRGEGMRCPGGGQSRILLTTEHLKCKVQAGRENNSLVSEDSGSRSPIYFIFLFF